MIANGGDSIAKFKEFPILCINCLIFDGNHFYEKLGDQKVIKIGTQLVKNINQGVL